MSNFAFVQQQINQTAIKTKLNSKVKIVAVSKGRSPGEIKNILNQNIYAWGENRATEILEKAAYLSPDIRWHFIGHLQRNKVQYILRLKNLKMIESVDSVKLAQKIDQEATKLNRKIDCLLQVNLAQEKQKWGFSSAELLTSLPIINDLSAIKVCGLMTMAPFSDDQEQSRPIFKQLFNLAEHIRQLDYHNLKMTELSMGMSQDYLVAVEEGATIVRLGRVLFD